MTDTPELIDRAEIKDGQAIVTYTRTEAAVADLRQRYQGAKYDLTTTAGDKAARAGRLELVTTRTALEKRRKELKAPAVEFGKRVDSEAARLTGELLALENPIDAQIKADEKRRDDERRAKEEAEAARRKVHTDGIAKIAGYVAQAAELSAVRIGAGIAFLERMECAGFEEFTDEACATRDRSIAALRTMQIKAQAREDEAARLEGERVEQARIAAEQAETARQLKAQQDELARQQAELAESQAKLAREEEARAQRLAQEEAARAEQERQQAAATVTPAATPAPSPAPAPAVNVHPMPTRAPAVPAGLPTLRLGQINERLGFTVSADFLASVGYPMAGTEKAAKLWHEANWQGICAAIAAHVVAVANGERAVA